MKERNMTITLEKAKEWYNSGNTSLKEVALQAFNEKELAAFDFTKIKTFEDALTALEYNESTKVYIRNTINDTSMYSRASAAMSQLNIIRKALNLGHGLHLTKRQDDEPYIYSPCNPIMTKDSKYFDDELNHGKMLIIGSFKYGGEIYNVLGGCSMCGGIGGLSAFTPFYKYGDADTDNGLFGCATKEIAEHFGKYFGMLITEAKYGDMVDFEIVENKYQ